MASVIVGAAAVSSALARNITITKLNLCDNGISHMGANALADMLKDNCVILQLDVSGKSIGNQRSWVFR